MSIAGLQVSQPSNLNEITKEAQRVKLQNASCYIYNSHATSVGPELS